MHEIRFLDHDVLISASYTYARYVLVADDIAELSFRNAATFSAVMAMAQDSVRARGLVPRGGYWLIGLGPIDDPGWDEHVKPQVVVQARQKIGQPGWHWVVWALIDAADLEAIVLL